MRSAPFDAGRGLKKGIYYSLPALEEAGIGKRLPVACQVFGLSLDLVLRNCDGKKVGEKGRRGRWRTWNAKRAGQRGKFRFVVARIVLQGFHPVCRCW